MAKVVSWFKNEEGFQRRYIICWYAELWIRRRENEWISHSNWRNCSRVSRQLDKRRRPLWHHPGNSYKFLCQHMRRNVCGKGASARWVSGRLGLMGLERHKRRDRKSCVRILAESWYIAWKAWRRKRIRVCLYWNVLNIEWKIIFACKNRTMIEE